MNCSFHLLIIVKKFLKRQKKQSFHVIIDTKKTSLMNNIGVISVFLEIYLNWATTNNNIRMWNLFIYFFKRCLNIDDVNINNQQFQFCLFQLTMQKYSVALILGKVFSQYNWKQTNIEKDKYNAKIFCWNQFSTVLSVYLSEKIKLKYSNAK